MKIQSTHLITVMIIMIISFLFSSYAFAYQNEPKSFRGIKWGTNIKDLSGMQLVNIDKNDKDTRIYIRIVDKLKIGKADLEGIFYLFYKNRFYAVAIKFNLISNYLNIKETLFEQYGAGKQIMETFHSWQGENTDIALSYIKKFNEGVVSYHFKSIEKELNRDREEKEKSVNGAGDL